MSLREALESGKFLVTAELGPGKGTDVEHSLKDAEIIKDLVDAINVTDLQSSVMRLGSMAVCHMLTDMGVDPIFQVTCRDRNRLALQSDLLSAWVLGIRNILCLSGDHQSFGSQLDSLNVFDIESMNLLRTAKDMHDDGSDMSGFALKEPPRMFIGAAANPFANPFEWRVHRLAKVAIGKVGVLRRALKHHPEVVVYDIERYLSPADRAANEGHDDVVVMLKQELVA